MNQIIYVYSTPTHKQKNRYKIGFTTQVSAKQRIDEQFNKTAQPEGYNIEREHNLITMNCNLSANYVEKQIHDILNQKKISEGGGNEWFELNDIQEFDDIFTQVTSITNEKIKESKKPVLELRPHQKEALIKIDECFSSYDKCLFFHISRSGKSYTFAQLLLEKQYQNSIVLTGFPILTSQWIDIFNTYKGLGDFNIINLSDNNIAPIDNTKKNLFFMSFQDAKNGGLKNGDLQKVLSKEKFNIIKDIEFDLICIDEVHHGVITEKSQNIIEVLKHKKLLGLSATPTKNLVAGDFSKDNTHMFTLQDEHEMKKLYPDLYTAPELNVYNWNLTKKEINKINYFSDEEQFTFSKFFRVENEEFYYKDDIIYLFKLLIGENSICGNYPLESIYPLKGAKEFKNVDTTLLFVPDTKSQQLLYKLLKSINVYNDVFDIHITNSKLNDSKKLYKLIKDDFKPKNGKKSLIISVEQLTTGITIECEMVMFMNDWKSLELYIQALNRCRNAKKGTDKCFVVDFNPTRTFKMFWDYNNIISKYNEKSTDDNISSFLECVNMFNRTEGGFDSIDFTSFVDNFYKSILVKPRFDYSKTIKTNMLSDNDVKNCLLSIGLNNGTGTKNIKFVDNDVEEGKSKTNEGKSKTNEDKDEDKLEFILSLAKILLDKVMLFPLLTNCQFNDIDECFKEIVNDTNDYYGKNKSEIILDVLKISNNKITIIDIENVFNKLFNKELVNTKIYEFNKNFTSILSIIRKNSFMNNENFFVKAIDYISDYLVISNSEKKLSGEVFTPFSIIEEMLDTLPQEFWSNPDLKILDPANGIGNFPAIIIKRLMVGLKNFEPVDELRYKHIIENMIYVCDIEPKNMFIYEVLLFNQNNKYNTKFYRGSFLDKDNKYINPKFQNKMKEWNIEKFDIIVGNPPYQEMDGGNGASAKPLYHKFVEEAIKITKYLLFITPSRWFAGGKGLDSFREMMLNRKDIKLIKHFNDASEVFNDVDIKGGVSYFLLDKKYDGDTCFNGVNIKLNEYDIIPTDIGAFTLIEKLKKYSSIERLAYSRAHYKISTNATLSNHKVNDEYIKVYFSQINGFEKWIEKSKINSNTSINKWKLITPRAAHKGGSGFGAIIVAKPNEICNDSYIHFGVDNEEEVLSLESYLKTNFANYMLSLRKITQDISLKVLKWIPLVPLDRIWDDKQLNEYFNLTENEIKIIEEFK